MSTKKNKIYLIIILLIISFISCKKINILSPQKIPPPTDFRIPDKLIPVNIQIEENIDKNSLVFGGFKKKFNYKGKWYILADSSYKYDKTSKKLIPNSSVLILELNDKGELKIIAENLGYSPDNSWNYLFMANIINDNEIIYEPPNYGECNINKASYKYRNNFLNKDVNIEYYDKITYSDIYYKTTDLLNWQKYGNLNNVYSTLPLHTQLDSTKPMSWQGRFGTSQGTMFLIDDYIYFTGLEETFYEQNPDGSRDMSMPGYNASKNIIYRIHKSKDMSDTNNWEETDTTVWKPASRLPIKYDDKKIYVGETTTYIFMPDFQNNSWGMDSYIFEYDFGWFTENFKDWTKFPIDNINYKNTKILQNNFYGDLGIVKKREKTPPEPNWVKSDNKVYYQTYNKYTVTNYITKYMLPIPPINEIKEAFDRGEKTFTIRNEHLKNAGKNMFIATDIDPNIAKEDDWKLLTPINYEDRSMIWQSGNDIMFFNINGKIIQLVDYDSLNARIQTMKDYQNIIYELTLEYESYYNNKNYYEAMYYKAQIDMLKIMMLNPDIYLMPDDAVASYTINFKY